MKPLALHSAIVSVLSRAVEVFSWQLQLREPLAVDTSQLSNLPLEVDRWQGREIPVEGGGEEMLDADFNVQRLYLHPIGRIIWLYVGYYGTERGGRLEHTSWICYPSNGWKILSRQVVDELGGELAQVNEMMVEKAGERLGHRIESGRAGGSWVSLSTPLVKGGDESAARSQLIAFAREIVPLLQRHWPSEATAS